MQVEGGAAENMNWSMMGAILENWVAVQEGCLVVVVVCYCSNHCSGEQDPKK